MYTIRPSESQTPCNATIAWAERECKRNFYTFLHREETLIDRSSSREFLTRSCCIIQVQYENQTLALVCSKHSLNVWNALWVSALRHLIARPVPLCAVLTHAHTADDQYQDPTRPRSDAPDLMWGSVGNAEGNAGKCRAGGRECGEREKCAN